jgi:hypothetical protein
VPSLTFTETYILRYSLKVRRGGVGSHFCIHKYFYERSPLWQQIRAEEIKATEGDTHSPSSPDMPTNTPMTSMKFDPMDARHLSSLPLVRARIIKLLKGSRNHMHPCNNILLTLVFDLPVICCLPLIVMSRDSLTLLKLTGVFSKAVLGNSFNKI